MSGLRPDLDATFSVRTLFVETIPVRDWIQLVRRLSRSRPLRVKVDYSYGFRHPWQTRVTWNPSLRKWALNVHPGYVNHEETDIVLTTKDGTRERVWLSNEPVIPVDATIPTEIVPDYFKQLGVETDSGVRLNIDETGGITTEIGLLPDPSERRLLRSCELIVTQPRRALQVSWGESRGDPSVQFQFISPQRKQASLSVEVEFRAERDAGLPAEQLLLGGIDTPFDRRHIATLYFLSPPGVSESAQLDETWEPIVKHRTFWNLRHATKQRLDAALDDTIYFPGFGLAGGVGDRVINEIMQQNTDATNRARALLNKSRIEGRFWTI